MIISDNSSKWNTVDSETKRRMNFARKNDGELWMSFDDFFKKYDRLSFVHINLNAFTEQQGTSADYSSWDFKQVFNSFSKQKDKWSYPQHVINLNESIDKSRSIIIALMTTDYVEKRKKGQENEPISFQLYLVSDKKAKLKRKYSSNELVMIGKSGSFVREREVTKRFRVDPGVYVIIPTTNATHETNYLLRICKYQCIK